VTGSGLGGRNQQLALKAAALLRGHPGVTLLAAGTDGTDGPTDMAGAVVDAETCRRADALGLEVLKSLRAFDAYPFFREVGGHVFTGPTLTNVMDVVLVLIREGGASRPSGGTAAVASGEQVVEAVADAERDGGDERGKAGHFQKAPAERRALGHAEVKVEERDDAQS